ncbi:HD domain-containing protein [Kitasatospora sp. NPDC001664]
MGGEGAPERLALLIGVGETPAAGDWFPPLAEAVSVDQRLLAAALGGSGYRVEVLRDPTRNEITAALAGLARDAPPGSTVLLHYTGHGIRVGDTDHLVPADARAPEDGGTSGWDQPHVLESLLDADLSRYLTACRAGTVLWLIDACRSAEEEDGTTEFGSRITKGPPEGGFAVMTACAPGQRAGYSAAGSFFTRALADAFDPLTEASTVEELYGTAARLTRQYARRERAGEQDVRIHYGTALEHETRTTPVAQGRRLLESWQEAVYAPGLWARVPAAEAALVTHLQECLTELATEVARQVHLAQKDLPDPWADDDFPVRVLRDRLPQLLVKGVELSALEAAALVAGVFLREAIWAERQSQAALLGPGLSPDQAEESEHRREYEQVMARHPEIKERIWSTHRRRAGEAAEGQRNAAVLWLVHRWIAERFETEENPVPAYWGDRLAMQILSARSDGASPSGRAAELSVALRGIAAAPVLGLPSEAEVQALPERHVVAGGSHRLRVRALSALLRLGTLLAVDTRMLPEIVIEHLVVSDPVLPRELLSAVRDAVWDQEDDELRLDAVCPHPAVHATLGAIVEEADGLCRLLREDFRRWPPPETALVTGLPSRVTDWRLRAEERQGRRAYDVPLLRFTLAQTEVRRLLMGEQLYDGQRELAVRELYQNAMDACRYRAMRLRYLRGSGVRPAPWEGGIRIAAGEDERGRYVECLDNGVGMTAEQLKETFTRAGRRFGQSQEFRREQAAWLRQDKALRLYPNSRFGIGVFSYFMLADEMEIVTRPVGRDGYPAPRALRVFIPGSGSLFRVQELSSPGEVLLPEGGTRVRLYLRDHEALTWRTCEDLLRSLVLVSEFRLEVCGGPGRSHVWEPGALQEAEAPGTAAEAVPGTLWWVRGTGAVLCDGIATDRRPFGYVLNLTGPHAGELSVSRTKLERYDTQWESEQWRVGAEALSGWPELTLGWLHELESHHLEAARLVRDCWRGRGVQARGQARGRYNQPIGSADLDRAGWFPLDRAFFQKGSELTTEELGAWSLVAPWRSAVLGLDRRSQQAGVPSSLVGFPVPSPGWSAVAASVNEDWRSVVRAARRLRITVADVLRVTRGLRVTHPGLAGPAVQEGDLDWEPSEYDELITDGLVLPRSSPRHTAAYQYRHSPEDLRGLVRASHMGSVSLGELAARCARYAPFLPVPLGEAPDWHRDHVVSDDDLALLYVTRDYLGPQPVGSPQDVVRVAARLGISPRAACARLSQFAWLGVPVPQVDAVERWESIPDGLLPYVTRYLDAASPGRPTLRWGATVQLAADLGITLREAESSLAGIADRTGLGFTRRYSARGGGGSHVPSEECGVMVRELRDSRIDLEEGLSLRDLEYGRMYEVDRQSMPAVFDDLGRAGVRLPRAAKLLGAWADLPLLSRHLFSGKEPSLGDADYPALPTPAVLFMAGMHLRQPLSEVWRNAQEECDRLGLPSEVRPAPLPKALEAFRPTRAVTEILVRGGVEGVNDDDWPETPVWIPLTARALAAHARQEGVGVRAAYESLAGLRAIGALLPGLTAEQIAALPQTVPSERDVVAVAGMHRLSERGSPFVPLDLVSIAGRLGEPLTETWRRLLPYLPMESTGEPIGAVPQVLPLWQDLAVLSKGLDGKLPALSGAVTTQWLEWAADGVGESAEWVLERLGHYAELFGLELPTSAE